MTQPSQQNERFLKACRLQPVDCTPVWFMRQAGRYMSEYRALRANHSLLELCQHSELAAEITLQPVNTLGVDAAIMFADILLPLIPMGINLEYAAGEGPVIHNPVRSTADIQALRLFDPREGLSYVMDTLRLVRRELAGKIPVIGFAGAPFTLASYVIEGGSSRNYLRTKKMMYSDPSAWHALMDRLADVTVDYLTAQVEAGAQVVQLFDSWVGALSPDDYREYVLPYSQRIFRALKTSQVPTIHFATGTATLLKLMQEAGGDVIGVDWRTPIDWSRAILGDQTVIQGNLDPLALLAPRPELERRVRAVLKQAGSQPGHIFNLGHGILPETPVENVRAVVEMVHEWTSVKAAERMET
jgi:uroporphyrinogen decarboxylase